MGLAANHRAGFISEWGSLRYAVLGVLPYGQEEYLKREREREIEEKRRGRKRHTDRQRERETNSAREGDRYQGTHVAMDRSNHRCHGIPNPPLQPSFQQRPHFLHTLQQNKPGREPNRQPKDHWTGHRHDTDRHRLCQARDDVTWTTVQHCHGAGNPGSCPWFNFFPRTKTVAGCLFLRETLLRSALTVTTYYYGLISTLKYVMSADLRNARSSRVGSTKPKTSRCS